MTLKKIGDAIRGTKYLNRFSTNNEGVAAVEFALIAPLLILLFLGTVETSYAVAVDRKISRTASAIADLVTQSARINPDDDMKELKELIDIADKIMQPYDLVPCIVVTGIIIKDGSATVDFSVDNSTNNTVNTKPTSTCGKKADLTQVARTKREKGTEYPVPDSIKIDDTYLVATEVEFDHNPIVGFFQYTNSALSKDTSAIVLNDEILLRPRIGNKIEIN